MTRRSYLAVFVACALWSCGSDGTSADQDTSGGADDVALTDTGSDTADGADPDAGADTTGELDTTDASDAFDASRGDAADAPPPSDVAEDASGDADVADADAIDGSDADASPGDPGPPNILIIIADDFGVDAASFDASDPCYEVGDVSNDANAPNLAALCREGVRFSNAWAMPVCSPTRATMLTGQWPFRHGVTATAGGGTTISTDSYSLPRALDDGGSGYATAQFGKWHIGGRATTPLEMGWDHYAGHLGGVLGDFYAWDRTTDGETTTSETYATTANVDDAIGWIGSQDPDQPWLVWLAFNAPHTPFHVPPSDLHSFGELPPYEDGLDPVPYFAAMVEAMDAEIGRLLTHLRDTDAFDNTVVIFIGDNGTSGRVADRPPFDRGRAKGSLYEGGLNVPFIIAGPSIRGGRSEDALVSVVDVFATVLELAGVNMDAVVTEHSPGHIIDSVSLGPCLDGDGCTGREWVLGQFQELPETEGEIPASNGYAYRDATHKIICWDDGRSEAYDLRDDRFEEGAPVEAPAVRDRMVEGIRAAVGSPGLCP